MQTPRVAHRDGVPPILAEIHTQGDLAANPQAIERLNRLLNKEFCTTLGLAHAILQDPGLSAKILRVVNSVAYSVRGEPVSTITRAILLIGFERVREIATGLLLIEQFTRGGAANAAVHENLRRALRCGLTAQAISVQVGQVSPEQGYLLGLFANLGLLWLAAYYPDTLEQARELERAGAHTLEEAVTELTGLTTAKLAAEVLEHWSLPDAYLHHFQRKPADTRGGHPHAGDRLSAVVEIADCHAGVAERESEPAAALLARFERTFDLPPQRLVDALAGVEAELCAQARILGIAMPHDKPVATSKGASPGGTARSSASSAVAHSVNASTHALPSSVAGVAPHAPHAQDASLAIDVAVEVTRSILIDDDVNHNLTAVVEGIARSGPFDVVVLALLTPKRDRVVARLCFGPASEGQLARLSMPLRRGAGLLAEAVLDRTPRIVEAGSASLLVPPGAAVPEIAADSFVIQPLVVRDRAVGVVLATRAGKSAVSRTDLPVVQMFCNLACIGLREIGRRA